MMEFFSRVLGRNERKSFQAGDIVSYMSGEIKVYGLVLSPRDYNAKFGYIPDVERVTKGMDVCLYLSTDSLHIMPASRLRKVDPKEELKTIRSKRHYLGVERSIEFLEKSGGRR